MPACLPSLHRCSPLAHPASHMRPKRSGAAHQHNMAAQQSDVGRRRGDVPGEGRQRQRRGDGAKEDGSSGSPTDESMQQRDSARGFRRQAPLGVAASAQQTGSPVVRKGVFKAAQKVSTCWPVFFEPQSQQSVQADFDVSNTRLRPLLLVTIK
jgi:hypothetical protein